MVKTLSIAVILVFIGFLIWFFYTESNADVSASIDAEPQTIYSNATADMIVVAAPTPGTAVSKTFSLKGNARGTWYFEASFPVELRDASNNILWQGPATAVGEWMTTEFVPFTAEVSVASAYSGLATLVLKKDNPSGMPEYDASIEFPIVIE